MLFLLSFVSFLSSGEFLSPSNLFPLTMLAFCSLSIIPPPYEIKTKLQIARKTFEDNKIVDLPIYLLNRYSKSTKLRGSERISFQVSVSQELTFCFKIFNHLKKLLEFRHNSCGKDNSCKSSCMLSPCTQRILHLALS